MKYEYFIYLAMPNGLQDLSSPTRDWTQAPAVKAPSPNPWAAREFPEYEYLKQKSVVFGLN